MKKLVLITSSLILLATFIGMMAQHPSMQQKLEREVQELRTLSGQLKAFNNTAKIAIITPTQTDEALIALHSTSAEKQEKN